MARTTAGTACSAASAAAACGTLDESGDADRRSGFAAHVDVIDLVGLHERHIRRHDNGLAFETETQVCLFGNTFEYARQRFIDCVQADQTLQSGMDINVLFGVPRQCEQQFFDRNLADHHGISRRLDCGFGRGHKVADACRRRQIRLGRFYCRGLDVSFGLRQDRTLVAATERESEHCARDPEASSPGRISKGVRCRFRCQVRRHVAVSQCRVSFPMRCAPAELPFSLAATRQNTGRNATP